MMQAVSEATPHEDLNEDAYKEGAFYASTDWQWVRTGGERPSSMAEHCAASWAFISGTVCPLWDNERMRLSFFIGYEDRATELANAGEAGYEALAEAGSVAETEGWVVQSEPWVEKASDEEKAMRALRAAWDSLRRGRLAWLWAKSGQLTKHGRPFDLMQHPWDCAQAQLLVQAATGAKDFRRIAQYRRACRAAFWPCDEDELYPAWLKPQRRAKVSHARRLKKDKALEAYDPVHPIGTRHELRQVFEATERRDEQVMMTEIVAAVYGKPPTWMKPREADKPGRKTKAGGPARKTTR